MGRRALGHLRRRHRHVQVLAEASVWESAGKDVPGVLHVDTSEFRYICGSICIPAPLEDSINHLAMYQLGFLVSALGCNLSNLLGFMPRTIEMMMKRHKMEKDLIGIGTEVVYSKNSETTKRDRKFGMIHGLSSLANIMSFGSLAMPCAPVPLQQSRHVRL
ncbi:hypothetical protein GQ55_8G251600 [Panicum hallii var. hallii]|uniref:Uncharacterized protein n=1 Tax=Panicum hallii var. hallii TaxID=1504633 RepID=A0A2T7CR00_9POAL|nr:hypothetical protein GQ55_8G251600 [Panicum hallii var. hallii]